MEVFPAEDPVEIRTAIPGQKVVFLVRLADAAVTGPSAKVTVAVEGATVTGSPVDLVPGKVAEVTVVPKVVTTDTTLTVRVTATRGSQTAVERRSLPVIAEVDQRRQDADAVLARFLPWLATAHPELGIGPTTKFDATVVGMRVLVVSHYLYFTPEWELHLSWHVMIPPDDWAKVDLRKRGAETSPSLAAEITSISRGDTPHETAPPPAIWR